MHGTREYYSWRAMISRCCNPKDPYYTRYGARGIRVCKRWRKFENFFADLGPRPPGKILDRIDNNGSYTPKNVRWATQQENQRNRSSNHILHFRGESLPLVEWAERLGMNPRTLKTRVGKLKWPTARALTTPLRGSQ